MTFHLMYRILPFLLLKEEHEDVLKKIKGIFKLPLFLALTMMKEIYTNSYLNKLLKQHDQNSE